MSIMVSGIYVGGRIITDLLEKDLIVRSISATNTKICGILAEYFYGEELFKISLEKLDIRHKLEVIESCIHNLPHDDSENKTSLIALHGIDEMSMKIHEELDKIKKKLEDHKLKWFYWARTVDISYDLMNLEGHVKNLDQRFDLFIKIRKL
jgi:hypothetical protein